MIKNVIKIKSPLKKLKKINGDKAIVVIPALNPSNPSTKFEALALPTIINIRNKGVKKFKFILEIEDCRRYFAENPEFKEILEYFNDLGGSYKLSKNEDFIRKFDLELKKRNPISL